MKCIIVDDDEMSRVSLEHLCKRINGLEVEGVCKNGSEAIQLLKEKDIDLVFLDIEMPHLSGIELVKDLNIFLPQVIFTTASKDYASQAFEYEVTDYLVKPIFYDRLVKSVNRAWAIWQKRLKK